MSFRGSPRYALALGFLALAVAACGGGSTNGTFPLPTQTPSNPQQTPTPIAAPASTPFTSTVATPLPAVTAPPAGQTPQPVPVALPTAAGFSGSIALPISSASAGTVAQAQMTNTSPSGIAAFSRARKPQTATAEITPLLYIGLLFTSSVSVANQPTITLSMPSNYVISGSSYYLALFDPTNPSLGWQQGFEGPGALNGTQLTFTGGQSTGAFTFAPWNFYWLAVYAQPVSAATPTPAPTPTQPPATPAPTPTPTPVVISGVALNAIGAQQTITPSGNGPFVATSSDTTVVTAAVSGSSVTLTAVAAGTATVTVFSPNGTTTIPVTVTTTTIPVQ